MMNLNRVELIGNCTADPEVKEFDSGKGLTKFRVATNRVWKDAKTKEKREMVEFHNILAWGKLGQIAGKYLAKGKKVYLDGYLKTNTWKDEDEKTRYKTEVVCENIILLGAPPKKDDNIEVVNEEDSPFEEEVEVKAKS